MCQGTMDGRRTPAWDLLVSGDETKDLPLLRRVRYINLDKIWESFFRIDPINLALITADRRNRARTKREILREHEVKCKHEIQREQEIDRLQEIKRKLQVIGLPYASLVLKQLRSRLDDGTKRNRGKRKFHEHERGYEILKERLYQLDSQFEEILASKQTLEHEIQESKQQLEHELEEIQKFKRQLDIKWWQVGGDISCQSAYNPALPELEQKLHNLKDEFEQKLPELYCQQQEILLRVSYLDCLLVWVLTLYAAHIEDGHEGGFRNLILDGWWLEFWEIFLLAAGDVERNPGPRQITDEELAEVSDIPIEEDDLSLVFDVVLPVSAKWSMICCSLGLRASLVDTIEMDHPRDVSRCLFQGLKQWILKNYDTTKHGLPSWRRLVEAVDDSSGGHNHALALEIAEKHKQSDLSPLKQGSVSAPIPAAVCSDPKKSQAMSTAFANMYRAISRLLQRSVQADELKEFLRCFCHPQSPRQLCVDPRVYEGATSTKDILKELCPKFINPVELFLLEGIVETFGSHQCKKLLQDFQDKFY